MDTSSSNASNISCLSFIPAKFEKIIVVGAPDFQNIKLCWNCTQQCLSQHLCIFLASKRLTLSFQAQMLPTTLPPTADASVSWKTPLGICRVLSEQIWELDPWVVHQTLSTCSQINFSHFWLCSSATVWNKPIIQKKKLKLKYSQLKRTSTVLKEIPLAKIFLGSSQKTLKEYKGSTSRCCARAKAPPELVLCGFSRILQ